MVKEGLKWKKGLSIDRSLGLGALPRFSSSSLIPWMVLGRETFNLWTKLARVVDQR